MAETIALNVNVNTGEAVSSLGQLEKATKKVTQTTKTAAKETQTLDQQFEALNKEIKESPVSIRAMNKQIQAYQSIALEAGRTSPLGKQAIQKAAAIKDKYIDIQNEVNRLANDGVKLKAALDIGSTMVAGFAGFQGVMALAGGESEELRASMVKLQGAMSLLMAVETLRKNLEKESTIVLVAKNTAEKANLILTKATTVAQKFLGRSTDTTTKSFKLMRGALIATGIGALVVLIGVLISQWDNITAALGSATSEQKAYNEASKQAIESISNELSAADKLQKVLNDETISREDKNKAIKALQKEYPNLLSNIDTEKNSLQEINKALELNTKLLLLKAKQEAVAQLRAEEFKKIIQAQTDAQTGANAGILEQAQAFVFLMDVQDFANAKTAQSIEVNQKQVTALDNVEAALQKEIDALKELGAVGEEEATAETERLKKVAKKKVKIEKESSKEIKKVKKETKKEEVNNEEAQFQLLQQLRNTPQENEINQLVLQYEKKFELANGNAELEKALAEQQAIDIDAINQRFKTKEDEAAAQKVIDDDAAKQKVIDDIEEIKQAKLDSINTQLDNASGFLDSLQTLNDVASGKSEAQQKKAFERNKKIESAQAMISAAKGVVNILGQTSLLPIPLDAVYKGVQISILAATLAAQLKKINSAKFAGGGSSIQTPSLGGGGGSAPTLNPISNTNTLIGQDNKVYVTETDISTTQNKVKVIEERATF
jgi:hypothetical protein